MSNEVIFEEYDRLYHNYDVCLKTFRDIIKICYAEDNIKVANIVEQALNDLKPVPVKEVENA